MDRGHIFARFSRRFLDRIEDFTRLRLPRELLEVRRMMAMTLLGNSLAAHVLGKVNFDKAPFTLTLADDGLLHEMIRPTLRANAEGNGKQTKFVTSQGIFNETRMM